jgi:hypothetical protein
MNDRDPRDLTEEQRRVVFRHAQLKRRLAGPVTPEDLIVSDWEEQPSIAGVKPPRGSVGTQVAISGRHLDAVEHALFSGTPARIITKDFDRIVTTVPEGANSGRIELRIPFSEEGSLFTREFVVVDPKSSASGTPSHS